MNFSDENHVPARSDSGAVTTVVVTVTLGPGEEQVFTSTLSAEYVNDLRESLAHERSTVIPLRDTPDAVAGGCVMISQMHLKPQPWSSGTYEPRQRKKVSLGRVLRRKKR